MTSSLSAVTCGIGLLPTPELVALWWPANRSHSFILVAEYQSPLFQIVRRDFDSHAIAREGFDPVPFHSAGGVGNEPMSIIEFNAISGVRQNLGNEPLKFQQFFFRHVTILLNGRSDAACFDQHRAAGFRSDAERLPKRCRSMGTRWLDDGDLACGTERAGAVRQHRQLLGIHARAAVDRLVDRSSGLTHG